MIDLEKAKTLIHVQWEEYRYYIEKAQQPTVRDNEKMYNFHIDRAKKYRGRAEGMEDLLYSLGYFVLHCSNGSVDIIERIDKEG